MGRERLKPGVSSVFTANTHRLFVLSVILQRQRKGGIQKRGEDQSSNQLKTEAVEISLYVSTVVSQSWCSTDE